MTDQRLPCYKINEEVAEMLGWDKIIDEDGPGWLCPGGCIYCAGGDYPHNHPPDYCGNWQHAGPLYTQLVRGSDLMIVAKVIRDIIEDLLFALIGRQAGLPDMDKLIKEAITRAFHAGKKEDE